MYKGKDGRKGIILCDGYVIESFWLGGVVYKLYGVKIGGVCKTSRSFV